MGLLKDAFNLDNDLKFMDFLLEPENTAAVSHFARYAAGVNGADKSTDPALAMTPESNPPGDVPSTFIVVCDRAKQKVYGRIWTRLRKQIVVQPAS